MSVVLKLNPEYKNLASFFEQLPRIFLSEGKDIYNERNHIKSFEVQGTTVVVKYFKHLPLFRRIIYTFFRKDKAIRSYENSAEIIRRGFSAPTPIAYVAVKKGGILYDVYYASALTDAKAVRDGLLEKQPYNKPLLDACISFVAAMHEKGILHNDQNSTNVLYNETPKEHYSFELIDVNRMKFFDEAVPKWESLETFTRGWCLDSTYKDALKEYVELKGWSEEDYQLAINLKIKRDKKFRKKQQLKALLKPFK